jgi:hypothetical protein
MVSNDILLRIVLGLMFGFVAVEPLYVVLFQPIPTVNVQVDLPPSRAQ